MPKKQSVPISLFCFTQLRVLPANNYELCIEKPPTYQRNAKQGAFPALTLPHVWVIIFRGTAGEPSKCALLFRLVSGQRRGTLLLLFGRKKGQTHVFLCAARFFSCQGGEVVAPWFLALHFGFVPRWLRALPSNSCKPFVIRQQSAKLIVT